MKLFWSFSILFWSFCLGFDISDGDWAWVCIDLLFWIVSVVYANKYWENA